MSKRIIPVSSGKGGVGKTSFAVNLALSLSKKGRCILVDLDTGTSSVRNTIDTPVDKDLYHFFKKGAHLKECITPLSPKLDKDGLYSNFGFVAAPRHLIDDIANMDQKARDRMVNAVNALEADYVILDLKAGLDPGVLDFMPQSNTGILVFTPHHPAATLAASDIAKAIVYRNVRELFHETSELYAHFPGIDPKRINRLVNLTENSYEEALGNMDALVLALHRELGPHPFVNILYHIVQRFQIYYVLNRFNGLDDSYETAVKPLVSNIHDYLSSRMSINNLGWILESEAYHNANRKARPFLLSPEEDHVPADPAPPVAKPAKTTSKGVDAQMSELYQLAGLKPKKSVAVDAKLPDRGEALKAQKAAMESMYEAKKKEGVKDNFDYILKSVDYVFENKRVSEFGTPLILKRGELVPRILKRKARQQNG